MDRIGQVSCPVVSRPRTRRARSTGTHVTLCRPGEELAVEEGWTLICEEHDSCVCFDTRREAEAWRSDPVAWCPDCYDTVKDALFGRFVGAIFRQEEA